ncbi:MAG: hypothetical protein WC676_04730 [Candidatus Omnitrophota bacterium]
MNIFVNKKQLALRMSLVLCIFLSISIVLGGCEPLRKKFTRQKKKDKDESMEMSPILEPIEYPAKQYSPEQVYQEHFSLWKVWQKELLTMLDGTSSRKRQFYAMEQIRKQLAELKALLADDKKAGVEVLLSELSVVEADMRLSVPRGSLSSWRSKVESIGKKMRTEYSLSKVKDSIKK